MTDLISRQAAIDAVNEWMDETFCTEIKKYGGRLIRLTELPTIDPVKHGKWMPHPTEPDWDVCSVCGIGTHRRFHYNDAAYGGYDVEESFIYCPHCGAKMDGEKEIHDHYNCTGCGFMSTCTDEEAQQCLKPHISQ